ncbi:hypothetical protein OS175_04955 [Marinicella sp. S1101]|uniref:leucine-rich repeat domain-containing protein n=1 Tax=Marinicella marina TaxID=2996016 RepID=UPI002260B07A|nr:hypothetical protein [Marinicella marina]MCX7553216.1 hypothetical protein [Marinicella marina]MDJ1138948.1 hypothetical protein [Marinicella marina]
MSNHESLDASQAKVLQQWFQSNGLSEKSFHFGTKRHQGAYSVLLKNQQVVGIKSKGVKSTTGLTTLVSLQSLELSLLEQAELSACPSRLEFLRIKGSPSEPLSLDFLKQCPNLTELKVFHTKIANLEPLAHLSKLQSVSVRFSDIVSIDFDVSLPQLNRLDLTNNQLRTISFGAPQNQLKSLFLSNNQLSYLPDLSPLRNLEVLSLDGNPMKSIMENHLPPHLKHLDIRKTAVLDLAALTHLSDLKKIQVQRKPKDLPSALNEKVIAAISDDSQLSIAEDLMQHYLAGVRLIEKLPQSVNGKTLGLSKKSAQRFSMSGTSKLSGEIRIDELQGLMRIPLAQTDDLLYQHRQVSISGQAQVSKGAFRIYSPVNLDFWSMAAVFVDHPRPDAPASSDLQRIGFLVYEALPDEPVTFQANLTPIADRYVLLVEGDAATGVTINYQ